jgi:hypothetical protein
VIADSVRPGRSRRRDGRAGHRSRPDTTDIFIEAANFVPSRTRRTRRLAGCPPTRAIASSAASIWRSRRWRSSASRSS